MTYPSGATGRPGTGGGIEHVKDLLGLKPGIVQYLTRPWTSPFNVDLRLVTAELTASTAYGYASELGVTGDEDIAAAGGSLEGSAGGVEDFWITPAGVLTIVLTDELALNLHNNDASQRIIEAFVVGDRATLQLREVLPQGRPELTNNNLRMFRSATAGDVVGEGLRWGAGAAVVVRIRAGDRFLGADGEVGAEGDSGRTYEPGFWSEGPDGVRRRGVGSAIAAGLPGAYLFESGLTEFEREHGQIRGLMIGLERAQAGPDWFMDARARNPENPVQATLTFNSGGNNPSTITVTLPANRDNSGLGARGNEWSMPVTAGNVTAVNGDSATKRWTIVSTPTNTYADVAAVMRASMGAGNVVLAGPGTQRFGNAGGLDFAGGQDAEEITAEVDADATSPKITLVYSNNTQQACLDAWDGLEIDGATILRCKELGGTDLTVRPEPVANVGRPFDQYYSEGALPSPSQQHLSGDWTDARLRLELSPGNEAEFPTPEGLVPEQIEMVVSMSPGSLNKSNPPLNLHITVTTPPGAFPEATTLNFGMGPEISGSIAYDPAVSVHNLQRTLSENARNNLAAALVGEHYALEVFLRDNQSRDVHRVIRNIEVVEEAPLDPKVLVGTLQWDVTPAAIAGVTADDLEGTYRAQFDTPYFPLTDYYFAAFIRGANGTSQIVRDRAQWAQVTHLDLAIDETEAGQIARDVFAAGDDHFDIELHFFADAVTLGAVAVTSRRVRIGAASGGGIDETARMDAGRALVIANQNDELITRLAADLASRPRYAAQMAVWPPNVAKHSGFQRKFQSTLSGLAAALATDGGATGTRFANVFRIFTGLSDGTIVQLHTEGWAFTEDDRQTVEWEVSAAEFNTVGATAATNGVEVWGEFRAVYGGGVDELRGRTNPVFIDFGAQDEWPVSRDEAVRAIADASDIGYAAIATTAELDAFLAAQAASKKPRLALFTAAISNHRYQGGAAFNIVENQVRYFKPGSVTGVNFFVLPSPGDAGGGGAASADVTIGRGLAATGGSNWAAYPIEEDIEADAYYKFFMRIGSSNRFMPTGSFKGQDFLNLNVTAAGAFAQGSGASLLGVPSPRPDADGVRTLFLARPANARSILVHSGDPGPHGIVRLDKLGSGGGSGELTQAQQIGLLQWAPKPAGIAFDSAQSLAAAIRTVRLGVLNPELLTGDIWVEGWTQGQRGMDRTKWSNAIEPSITITQGWADAAATAIITDSEAQLEVRLRFFDAANGGNEIERIGINVPVVRTGRAPNTLQAAVVGGDAAGVGSIVLPANFQANWRKVSVAIWGRNQDRIAEETFSTAMVAVQANGQILYVDGNLDAGQADNAGFLTWTPATRTLAAGNNDRIIFAELHD